MGRSFLLREMQVPFNQLLLYYDREGKNVYVSPVPRYLMSLYHHTKQQRIERDQIEQKTDDTIVLQLCELTAHPYSILARYLPHYKLLSLVL